MGQLHRQDLTVARERAVLVAVDLYADSEPVADRLKELHGLAAAAGAEVVGELSQRRRLPSGRTFIGKGKIKELAALAEATSAAVIIFDHDLTPAQIQNIEEETERKIIDRSELILDIFASRARTHEARLQVEIAQLEYTYPRLRAMWDHLGQVTGGAPVGIGTRGPGEQQLEIDRRLVQRRLKQLRTELTGIHARSVREVHRRNSDHFTVGVVGYTNAGKSTLFNALTSGGAWEHDQVFATLSTRVERWELGGGTAAMLSDTVGFIRRLPHHLVASFKSTLEETIHCKLLLIVVDATDPGAAGHLEVVQATLEEIGATVQPRVLVINKIDALRDRAAELAWVQEYPEAILVSATTGDGLSDLAEVVSGHVVGPTAEATVSMPSAESRSIDFLEKRAEVLDRAWEDDRSIYRVRIGRRQVEQLMSHGIDLLIDGMAPGDALDALWPPAPPHGAACQLPPHRLMR